MPKTHIVCALLVASGLLNSYMKFHQDWTKNVDIKAKIPQNMNKIARIFVRDIRGIDFINLEITQSVFKIGHMVFGS